MVKVDHCVFDTRKMFAKISLTGEGNNGNEMYSSVNFAWGINSKSNKRFPKQKNLFCKLFTMGEACVVSFCIFQIRTDKQCSGEIPPVGHQCKSAVEDLDKSD